jgi:NAD(P)-dependent dehydrogenase (short-subunit alcohol dehydrogenase family)
MGRLDGLVALVTGGGRGIGRAIALELAREGADVAVSSRSQGELDHVVGEVSELGRRGLAVTSDATVREQARGTVDAVVQHFGQLDILVNNVGGVTTRQGFADHDPFAHDDDVFVDNLNLNLVTHYWSTAAALPQMRERSYGRIINIGSVSSVPGAGKGVAQDWPILAHAPAPLPPAIGAKTISVCELNDAVCDYRSDEDGVSPIATAIHTGAPA